VVNGRSTRRGFLAATGAAGLSAGLGLASSAGAAEAGVAASSSQGESNSVNFYGPHQGGIATATQQYLQFAALDIASDSRNDLRWVLRQLSSGGARLAMGKTVGATETGGQPPVDTGEAIGLSPASTTVTIGLGPGLFAPRRFGLASPRPSRWSRCRRSPATSWRSRSAAATSDCRCAPTIRRLPSTRCTIY
jgi:deferrochelatase/peroxidase EfeB